MKRFTIIIVTIAVLIATLAGCNKGSSNGKISFSVGGWPTEEGADLESFRNYEKKFEEGYPNYDLVPDTWKFSVDTFFSKAASGQLPDLYSTNFTEVPIILNNEYAADLTDVLKETGIYDKFDKRVLDVVQRDGKVYSFPYEAYVLGVAFNTDLFERAGLMNEDGSIKNVPQTWEELRDTAVIIKEKTGVSGFTLPTSGNCGGWMFSNIAWSYGTEFMKYENGKWIATFDSNECVFR